MRRKEVITRSERPAEVHADKDTEIWAYKRRFDAMSDETGGSCVEVAHLPTGPALTSGPSSRGPTAADPRTWDQQPTYAR